MDKIINLNDYQAQKQQERSAIKQAEWLFKMADKGMITSMSASWTQDMDGNIKDD